MKGIKWFYLVFIALSACGQSKEKAVKAAVGDVSPWPKPIKDSAYWYSTCDTVRGTVHVYVGNGEIKCKGFVTSCLTWQGSMPIYSPKDKKIIDSLQRGAMSISLGGSISSGDPTKTAYMITSKGNVRIEGPFTLSPE